MPPVWSSPVRYVECDQQGIVFNGHYLVWADDEPEGQAGAPEEIRALVSGS